MARRLKAAVLEQWAARSQREARYEEAAATLQAAMRLLSDSRPNTAVVSVLARLAENARLRGDYRGAVEYYRRAARTIQETQGRDSLSWASASVRLAGLLTELGNYSEAEELFSEAMRVLEALERVPPAEVITALRGRSTLVWRQDRLDEAEVATRKALTMIESEPHRESDRALLDVLQDLHSVYFTQGRYKDAERVMERALSLASDPSRVEPTYLARLETNLGTQYSEEGRYAEAERILMEALASHERAIRPSNIDRAYTLHNLGVLYSRQRRYLEAELHLRQALKIFQETLGPESPRVANGWYSLGTLHRDQGKSTEALEELRLALTIQESVLPSNHPDLNRTRTTLTAMGFRG